MPTSNSITVNTVTIPTNPGSQSVEYGINTANSAPTSNTATNKWQDTTSFSGLSAATQYYFFARSKENTSYAAGAASSGTAVMLLASGTYQITKPASGASGYSLAKDGTSLMTNSTTQSVIDYIQSDASGAAVVIYFDNVETSTNLSSVPFSGTWGAITLQGSIAGQNEGGSGNPVSIITLTANFTGSITSTANITNRGTSSTNSAATIIHNSPTGTLTISGGTVSGGYRTIHNQNTGTVTITGGTLNTTATSGRVVYNQGSGTINISGGTLTTGTAIYTVENGAQGNYTGNGTVNISGGTIAGAQNWRGPMNISGGTITGQVRGYHDGKITVSDNAVINGGILLSNNTNDNSTNTAVRLEITGGTISATGANNVAVENGYYGAMIISGGTITAGDTFAVQSSNANAQLTLSGNPTITGRIRPTVGKFNVTAFNPGTKTYTLDYRAADYVANNVAVTDGASHLARFTLYNQTAWKLVVSGSNLVIAAN